MLKWLWEWLQNDADKAFGWSFLGFWVGLIIGIAGLWLSFYYQRQPKLKVTILSCTPIQSIKGNIDNLQILYGHTNILTERKKLYVITLRVSNEGRANIGKGDYDEKAPLSIQIVDPKNLTAAAEINIIQEPEVLTSNDPYLKKHLALKRNAQATVIMEPIILDARQFFTIKLVALIPEAFEPTIKVFGKITGIQRIELVDELKTSKLDQVGMQSLREATIGMIGLIAISTLLTVLLSFLRSLLFPL